MTDDLLGDLLRDLMGARVLDIGSEFQVTKAKDAFALVQNYAADARELPVRNEWGMFPRIKVMDHRDLELLRVLVANHAAELKENLIESAGRFALGSEHVHLGDLHNMGAEYVQAVQLVRALEKEHDTKTAHEQETAEAKRQANEAYEALAAIRDRETDIANQMQDHDALVIVARESDVIREHVMQGRKISAIKELRTQTNCGLAHAKRAVEAAYIL